MANHAYVTVQIFVRTLPRTLDDSFANGLANRTLGNRYGNVTYGLIPVVEEKDDLALKDAVGGFLPGSGQSVWLNGDARLLEVAADKIGSESVYVLRTAECIELRTFQRMLIRIFDKGIAVNGKGSVSLILAIGPRMKYHIAAIVENAFELLEVVRTIERYGGRALLGDSFHRVIPPSSTEF